MSAEGRKAIEGFSSAEKLRALGEMYFRCVALSQIEELMAESKKMAEGREKAIMELGKMDKDFKDYKTWAQAEAARHHEHGFNHAIRQAKRFFDLKGHEFDIGINFYKGVYMSYDDMPDDAAPDKDVEPLYVETDQQVGVDAAGGEIQAEDTQAEETRAEEERYIDIEG
ncbi:hypothetical protein Fmac_017443 [Flemingia macrophylla]|uniref:Uncharacterized protein n=1 Tax=Flemingia macrophylla TaxID=520843 RepID=A0ABD1M243_9FABA